MQRLDMKKDIKPLSEFRANTAECIRQVQQSKRPTIITHHGKSAAVLVDVGEFEALLQRVELMEEIRTAEAQIDAEKGVSHEKALRTVMQRLRR